MKKNKLFSFSLLINLFLIILVLVQGASSKEPLIQAPGFSASSTIKNHFSENNTNKNIL